MTDGFADILIRWYADNHRRLPWRETSDPYLIWLSEVILQQTRVAQGLDYFRRFVARFPDVRSLAEAPQDEVRMLDNRYALLFIRGERPVMDEKYDILKHPNIALTEDGGAAPYQHGGTENAVATLSFAGAAAETISAPNEPIPDYELLSDEDIEALF